MGGSKVTVRGVGFGTPLECPPDMGEGVGGRGRGKGEGRSGKVWRWGRA